MLQYKFRKNTDGTFLHLILEDNWDYPCPRPRPPTEKEVEEITNRRIKQKVEAIIQHYKNRINKGHY